MFWGVSLERISGVFLWGVSLRCVSLGSVSGVYLWSVSLGCVTEECHWGVSLGCVSGACHDGQLVPWPDAVVKMHGKNQELSAAIALLLGNKNLSTRRHPLDGPLLAAGIALEHQKLSTPRSFPEMLQSFTCMCCQKAIIVDAAGARTIQDKQSVHSLCNLCS